MANDDKQLLDALDAVARELGVAEHEGLAAVPSQCAQYAKIRPFLKTALPFIAKIPVYGSKIAAAVTFLMTIADSVCNIH